jgi:hypothetical protein
LLYGFILFALITVIEFLALGFWKIFEFYSMDQTLFYASIAPIAVAGVLFLLALKYA